MTPVVTAIYVIPPILALLLSFFAKSRAVRLLLQTASIAFLTLFAITQAAHLDCQFTEFTFLNCEFMPPSLGRFIGNLQILLAITYVFGGPVLLVLAAIVEMFARSRR